MILAAMEENMRKRTVLFALGGVLLLALVATPIVLAPGRVEADTSAVPAVDAAEQAAIIETMRPTRRERPVIAIVTRNDGTEVTDFLVSYGVLKRADIADVVVVAERDEPVQLYPSLRIEPDTTADEFDRTYPEGADYVVVPAMDPGTDPFVAGWLNAQYGKGARIVSVCNGSRMIATAGLLDGRRATGHWSAIAELRQKHPTMEWVQDRRYVSDNGVTTTTGITATMPAMLALVEAIGGRPVAERVAGEIGLTNWDARHRSASFELTGEHKKTFVRNTLTFWRHETMGVPLAEGMDEISLGLIIDAYARTELADVVAVADEAITSRNGLLIHPDRAADAGGVDDMLPPPPTQMPALTLEQELPRIAARYDRPTAAIVALVMEYPWSGQDSGSQAQ